MQTVKNFDSYVKFTSLKNTILLASYIVVKLGEMSVIHQTKTIQMNTYN